MSSVMVEIEDVGSILVPELTETIKDFQEDLEMNVSQALFSTDPEEDKELITKFMKCCQVVRAYYSISHGDVVELMERL